MSQADASTTFERLHPKVQRWIWRQGWQELRDIQELAIPALIESDSDLIIAAATASGKTEAAFLPIVSRLGWAEMKPGEGFGALYISPLRALINDQFGRLESLCDEMEIPVFKWHGDVPASVKARARKKPEGIVLITPESLEALLMRSGLEGPRFFSKLSHIVIDELHAFMDAPRGKQLQSLLNRIERMAGRRIPRVGLSATLADMRIAAGFLRPLDSSNVKILQSASSGQGLKLQLRGYIEPAKPSKHKIEQDDETEGGTASAIPAICEHLFETLRGSRNLIFAGSRKMVEIVSAKLTDICERTGVPGEFLTHHGSLSRAYREEAERRMKDERLPASIVCTTTLELGIDIGNIESVAQIGAGHTVSGMRQRLGRSGRRPGQEAIFRVYTIEEELLENIHPTDALRPDTIQAIAMIELMFKRWNEPPNTKRLHLSTLMHQILALICQHGGITAQQAWALLIESKIFPNVDKPLFIQLLKRMGDSEVKLLEQASDGTLLLGAEGERITASFDFYAVFETPEEYRVMHGGRELGRLPMVLPYQEGNLLIFGGRYWRVLQVDLSHREILVEKGKGGIPPKFGGEGGPQSDIVVAEMRRIYEDIAIPRYLDKNAIDLLHQARRTFTQYELASRYVIQREDSFLLFPWLGSAGQRTLQLALMTQGLNANSQSTAISVEKCEKHELKKALAKIADSGAINAEELAKFLPEKIIDKFDHFLDPDLQTRNFASVSLDTSKTIETTNFLLKDI